MNDWRLTFFFLSGFCNLIVHSSCDSKIPGLCTSVGIRVLRKRYNDNCAPCVRV